MSDSKVSIESEEFLEEEIAEVPVHFLPIIDDEYTRMEHLRELAEDTHCFGHLWQDEEGVCPAYRECALAEHCKNVYERVQNSDFGRLGKKPRKKRKQSTAHLTGERGYLQLMGFDSRDLDREESHKYRWEGTSKYTRHGYHDLGRPVDKSVRRLVHELGYPPVLEKNWKRHNFDQRYGHLGRIVMAQTTSYHLVLVDSKIICRMWTNAAGFALTDVSALLLAKAEIVGYPTIEVPPKCHRKIRPCTGRLYIKDEENAATVASWIINIYKLKIDQVQGAIEGRHIAPAPESKLKKQPDKKHKK